MKMLHNVLYQQDLAFVSSCNINWKVLDNSKILITGATGLIGSFLVDVLMFRNKHYNSNILIYAISRNTKNAKKRFNMYWENPLFKFISHDITEKININNNIDYIIHGASNAYPAVYVDDPVGTMKANIMGLINLMDYGIDQNIKRILYISSGEVYGEGENDDFKEPYSGFIDHLNPRSCYPASKRATETLCISYSVQYDVDVVIARPCHIYGPTITESDNRAFAQFVWNVLAEKDVVLKSTGMQYRSYCYIADCASAILTILLKGEIKNAYNISNKDSNVRIAELANSIAKAGNREVIFDLPTNDEQRGYSVISRAVLDSSKLEELGWKANYKLPDGVKRTIQILKTDKNNIRPV
jgi:nucleoside-diphosphate-sugar epimerase